MWSLLMYLGATGSIELSLLLEVLSAWRRLKSGGYGNAAKVNGQLVKRLITTATLIILKLTAALPLRLRTFVERARPSPEDDMPFMDCDKDRDVAAESAREARGRSHEIAFNS
jgi:hypothetical protein